MKTTSFQPDVALEIQFRHMPKSRILEQLAEQQLDTFHPFTTPGSRCTVVFDRNHSSKHNVTCEITTRLHIPGQKLYVAHVTGSGDSKELLFTALNDAFGTLRRQIRKNRTKRYHHRRLAA